MPRRRDLPAPSREDLLAAAEELVGAFAVAADRAAAVEARLAHIRAELDSGVTLGELFRRGERPVLVHAANDTLEALLTAGTRFRRLMAQSMYADGLTMDEIAEILDVSRQRVARLLSADPEPAGPLWRRHRQG